jgi:hypothetical protein
MGKSKWGRREFLQSAVAVTALQTVSAIDTDRTLEAEILEVIEDGYRVNTPEITRELWGSFESRRREIRYNTLVRRKLREMERRGLVERKPITEYPPPMRLAPVWLTT